MKKTMNKAEALGDSFIDMLNLPEEELDKLRTSAEKFELLGAKIIHSPESRDGILTAIKQGSSNPIEVVANLTVGIVGRVEVAVKQANAQVEDYAKLEAAYRILKNVADIGATAKLIPKLSPKELQASYAVAVEKYITQEIKAGRIDAEKLKQSVGAGYNKLTPEQQEGLNEQALQINATATGKSGMLGRDVEAEPEAVVNDTIPEEAEAEQGQRGLL